MPATVLVEDSVTGLFAARTTVEAAEMVANGAGRYSVVADSFRLDRQWPHDNGNRAGPEQRAWHSSAEKYATVWRP